MSKFFSLAVPASLTMLLNFLTFFVNTMYAGHLADPMELAKVGIGNVLVFTMVMAILQGFSFVQDQFTTQAYGNGKLDLCVTYWHRGSLIVLIIWIPLALLFFFFSESMLVAFGQDEELSRLAQGYIRVLLLAALAYG